MRTAHLLSALLLLVSSIGLAAVTVEPNPLQMKANFSGGTIKVRGPAQGADHIFVTISGKTIDEKFNQKGRIGPVWATVGKVTTSGVPGLHLMAGDVAPKDALAPQEIQQHLLTVEALARRVEIKPKGDKAELLQREYLKLKRDQQVVAFLDQGVSLAGGQFEASLPWPDTAPAGTYTVTVLHVRNRSIVHRETAQLEVKLVGLPRFISTLAFQRAALYGLLSIAVALGVGFLMGLVFKGKGGGH